MLRLSKVTTPQPSRYVTAAFTNTPTALPMVQPVTTQTIATETPVSNMIQEVPWIPISLETILLTFIKKETTTDRHSRRRLRQPPAAYITPTTTTAAAAIVDNNKDWLLSPSIAPALLAVTSQHILRELRECRDTDLTLTRRSGNAQSETVALTGTLFFSAQVETNNYTNNNNNSSLPDWGTTTVRDRVRHIFQQVDAAQRYVDAVQAVGLAPLTHVAQVVAELPREASRGGVSLDEFWWQWHDPIWLTFVACAGAGVLGLWLVLCSWCCAFCQRRRRQRQEQATTLTTRKSSVTQSSSTSDKQKKQRHQKNATATHTNPRGGRRAARRGRSRSKKPDADLDPPPSLVVEGTKTDHVDQYRRDAASVVSSVYSYIDHSLTLDDQSYSVAPCMYPDDEDYMNSKNPDNPNRSVLWSVMDELNPDRCFRKGHRGDGGVGVVTPPPPSPSRMIVTTTGKKKQRNSASDVMIFSDDDYDDDDVSAISDRAAMSYAAREHVALKRPPPQPRTPLGDLTVVEESSRNSFSGTESSGGPSPQSINTATNNTLLVAAAKSEDAGDDDSMYMGPMGSALNAAAGTGKITDQNINDGDEEKSTMKVVALSPRDQIGDFRVGPLVRGWETLTKEERRHLKAPPKDIIRPCSNNQNDAIMPIPVSYSRDDGSVKSARGGSVRSRSSSSSRGTNYHFK
jgi:hypothetical protein